MTKLAWSTLFVFTLILEIEAYKNSGPLPKPRCKQPKVPASLALLTEEGVIENGTLVIRKELIVTKEDPETSEYHLV